MTKPTSVIKFGHMIVEKIRFKELLETFSGLLFSLEDSLVMLRPLPPFQVFSPLKSIFSSLRILRHWVNLYIFKSKRKVCEVIQNLIESLMLKDWGLWELEMHIAVSVMLDSFFSNQIFLTIIRPNLVTKASFEILMFCRF